MRELIFNLLAWSLATAAFLTLLMRHCMFMAGREVVDPIDAECYRLIRDTMTASERELISDSLYWRSCGRSRARGAVKSLIDREMSSVMDQIRGCVGADEPSHSGDILVTTIRFVYLLEVTSELPSGALDDCVSRLCEKLKGMQLHGIRVCVVEKIQQGSLVDESLMWPSTPGFRVWRPLGVCVRTDDGRVIEKARVLCDPSS